MGRWTERERKTGRSQWDRRTALKPLWTAGIVGLAGCSSTTDSRSPGGDNGDGNGDDDADNSTRTERSAAAGSSNTGAADGTAMYRIDVANSGHAPNEPGPLEKPGALTASHVFSSNSTGTLLALTEPES